MSILYQEQTRMFPTSGTDHTRDGAPLSTRLGTDLVTGVNNLAYVHPYAGYVQNFNTKRTTDRLGDPYTHRAGEMAGLFSNGTVIPNGEYFLAQVPTMLPKVNAHRICWTLGIYPLPATTDTGNVTIASIQLYISPAPYTGQVNVNNPGVGPSSLWETDAVFDISKIGSPYGKSSNACNIVVTNPTSDPGYFLIDQSAGTTGPWQPPSSDDSFLTPAHLILTATISYTHHSGEPVVGIFLADFNWWLEPE